MSKEIQEMGEQVVKSQVKPPYRNNFMQTGGASLDDGDNAKYMRVNIQLFQMSKVDLHDPDAVNERLSEFFQIFTENDMKPTIAGMAMALGIDRRRLWEIKTGNYHTSRDLSTLPGEVTDAVKKAYLVMENLWETYMNSGKINPVSGIFLGKNNFGYQDKQEMVLTPNTQNESDFNEDDLRKRYLTDSTTIDS